MKNFLKKAICISILFLTTSCATTANYEKTLNTWLGSPVDNLVSSWGAPSSEYGLSNGGKVIEYVKVNNVTVGGYTYTQPVTTYQNGTTSITGNYGTVQGQYNGTSTTYVQKQAPIQNISMSCKTRFTINQNGIITNWAWEGNACRQR